VINATMFDPVIPGRSRSAIAPPRDELIHFELCPMCGQAVDRRDIYAVMHHLPVGHTPLPVH
jgi:hypothetical protein